MARQKPEGKRQKAKAPARLSCLLSYFILQPVSLLLCSCAGDNQKTAPADPLLGTAGVPVTGQAAAPSKAAAAPAGALPPLPAPTSLTSNAALTAGGPRPLEAGHELRIGTGTEHPGGAAWAGQGSQAGPAPGRSDVVAQPVARGDGAPATGILLSGGGARVESFDQLQAQLVARGITWQRFECVEGEWHFSCSVPSRQNPNLSHTYEARSRDPQGLAAIRAALDQIDKEQR
jgi:hypothetical protein